MVGVVAFNDDDDEEEDTGDGGRGSGRLEQCLLIELCLMISI